MKDITKSVFRSDAEVLSLAKIKNYLDIPSDITEDDTFLSTLLCASIKAFEVYTNQVLVEEHFELISDCWGCQKELWKVPVVSAVSLKYYDVNGELQLVDDSNYYIYEAYPFPYLRYDSSFDKPALYDRGNSVRFTYKAGIMLQCEELPCDIEQGLLSMIKYFYENRDCECTCVNMPSSAKLSFSSYVIHLI